MTWLKALSLSILALLAPIHAVMATAGGLILTDLLLGVLAAHKRGDLITSGALRRTVTKMVVYQCAIITGFFAEHYMMQDALPVVKLVASAIAMVELKSILENLDDLNGASVFKTVMAALGSKNDEKPKE